MVYLTEGKRRAYILLYRALRLIPHRRPLARHVAWFGDGGLRCAENAGNGDRVVQMTRFNRQDVLIGSTGIASGIALIVAVIAQSIWPPLVMPSWLASGALIGAGILLPFRRPWTGAAVGFAIQLILLAGILWMLRDFPAPE
jgi:hypothetical protein